MTDETAKPAAGAARAPGRPAAVDRAAFQAELDELRAREKAHTREGDAIAAARRRLPMVEVNAGLTLTGPRGPLTLLDTFEGRGQLGHGPGRLVEAVGLDLVEDFPALFTAADQPGPFEHDQMLGDGLAGERHPSGQPAGAHLAVADQQVKDVAARWLGDGRPQLIVGLRRHPARRSSCSVARRSRYSTQPSWCSPA